MYWWSGVEVIKRCFLSLPKDIHVFWNKRTKEGGRMVGIVCYQIHYSKPAWSKQRIMPCIISRFISFCFGSHSTGLCSTTVWSSERSSSITYNSHAYFVLLRTHLHFFAENEHPPVSERWETLQQSLQVEKEQLRNQTAPTFVEFEQYFFSDNTKLRTTNPSNYLTQLTFSFFQL